MIRRKLMFAALTLTAAACGTQSSSTTAETTAALETAQCDLGTFEAAAAACRATYDACIAVEGADLDACRSALHDCLPPPPDHRGHGPGDMDGGCRPPDDLDGGLPPPRDGRDGPPPPPRDADGGFPGGPHGDRGPAPIVQPDAAAIQACRDALDACLAADATDVTCRQTEHDCVRAAFDAAFQAACDTATTDCANDASTQCTQLLHVCSEGVAGGTCNAVN